MAGKNIPRKSSGREVAPPHTEAAKARREIRVAYGNLRGGLRREVDWVTTIYSLSSTRTRQTLLKMVDDDNARSERGPLPPEILCEIFSFLKLSDLNRISLVI